MPPIVSTDWRRCIFPPNQLFLYFTTTKVIEKDSNYKVLFNNVYRLAAAPLNCCKLRATRPASGKVQLLFSRVRVFPFSTPTRDASPPLVLAFLQAPSATTQRYHQTLPLMERRVSRRDFFSSLVPRHRKKMLQLFQHARQQPPGEAVHDEPTEYGILESVMIVGERVQFVRGKAG